VREAAAAAAASSAAPPTLASSLTRAAAVGAHAFARLALFAEGELPLWLHAWGGCMLLSHLLPACLHSACPTCQPGHPNTLAHCPSLNGLTNHWLHATPPAAPTPALLAADASLQAQVLPLQTAFVPQSFCPAWRAAHTYQLQLTGSMLAALATQVRCRWLSHGTSKSWYPTTSPLPLRACPSHTTARVHVFLHLTATCVQLPCRACEWRCGTTAPAQRQHLRKAAVAAGSGRFCWGLVLCPWWMCCASPRLVNSGSLCILVWLCTGDLPPTSNRKQSDAHRIAFYALLCSSAHLAHQITAFYLLMRRACGAGCPWLQAQAPLPPPTAMWELWRCQCG